jgi:hypothetical protein
MKKMSFGIIAAALAAMLAAGCTTYRVAPGGQPGYGNYPPQPNYPNYPPRSRGGYPGMDGYGEAGGYTQQRGGGYRESGGSQTSLRESGGGRANCKGNLTVSVSDGNTPQQEVKQVMDYVTALLCDNPPEMTPAKPSIIDWKADWKPASSGSLKTKSGTTIRWSEK